MVASLDRLVIWDASIRHLFKIFFAKKQTLTKTLRKKLKNHNDLKIYLSLFVIEEIKNEDLIKLGFRK